MAGRRLSGFLAGLIAGFALSLPAMAAASDCQNIALRYSQVTPGTPAPILNAYLVEAAEGGCRELVEHLLADGAPVAMRGRLGDSVLHHAARAGEDEIVEILIAHGAAIDLRDLKGATPLSYAIEASRAKTTKLLLDRGANPDVEGDAGVTPLEAAAFNGSDRTVEALLKRVRFPLTVGDGEERDLRHVAGEVVRKPASDGLLACGARRRGAKRIVAGPGRR